MPIIASQHQWKDKDHVPSTRWPDDCTVQWGSSGVVLGNAPYKTAFFEAFPKNDGFIRGEGETIAAAEEKALAKFLRASVCEHQWSRGNYTNGGCICKRCGHFNVHMQPIVTLGDWKSPPSAMDLTMALDGTLMPRPWDDPDEPRKYARRCLLRLRAHGFDIPDPPLEPSNISPFSEEEHPYVLQCRDIIFSKLQALGGPDGINEAATSLTGLFDKIGSRMLAAEYENWLERQAATQSADEDFSP